MADIRTGHTVHELVDSRDVASNLPISGATFDTIIFKDGVESTGTTLSYSLTDASNAIFDFEFSASTTGIYQFHAMNNSTSVIYVSEIYNVLSDSNFDTTVYVGI